MSLVKHAKSELQLVGYGSGGDVPENNAREMIGKSVLDLIEVFSAQGHSGLSASFCLDTFVKLAKGQTLSPLSGEESEWFNYADDWYQNYRCSAIFKKGVDGDAYYLDAIVFRELGQITFTGEAKDLDGNNISSRQFIKFPFTPRTFYVDIHRDKEGNAIITDDAQLAEALKHYVR